MAKLVVKAECAMVRVGDRFVTLLKHALVPVGADVEHVKTLLERGIVADGDPVAGLVAPDRAAPFTTVQAVDDIDGDGPIPAKSADKPTWVAFAVSKGATAEDADAATKDDLIATYGTP